MFIPDIVLYHDHCYDGITAAYVVKTYCERNSVPLPQFKGVIYARFYMPDCQGKNVLYVDFCPKQEQLNEVLKVCKQCMVIDHHETTKSIVMPEGMLILDMTKSGAQLTHDYFFESAPRHPVINYIGDRDIWTWALPNSHEINAFIMVKEPSMAHIQELIEKWDKPIYGYSTYEMYALDVGKWLLLAQDSQVKSVAKNFYKALFKVDENVYNVLIGDCPFLLRSEVGNYLAKNDGIDFVMLYTYYANSQTFNISLRGIDKVDVSAVAKKFGGGGHKNASGMSVKDLSMYVAFIA